MFNFNFHRSDRADLNLLLTSFEAALFMTMILSFKSEEALEALLKFQQPETTEITFNDVSYEDLTFDLKITKATEADYETADNQTDRVSATASRA